MGEYRWIIYCIAILLGTSCNKPEQVVDTSAFANIDSLLLAEYKADRFHGSVMISEQDSNVFTKHYGLASRVWDISIDGETRFDIASVNKSFIAALTLIAVEEGRLDLDSKLVDLLKGYDYAGAFHLDINIHQMLCHTSGLPDYDAVPEELQVNGFAPFKRLHFENHEYIHFISQLEAVSTPNRKFYYSNFAYHLLCIALEDIYEDSFENILQKKICEPLRLSHTFSSVDNEEVFQEVAEGYDYSESTGQWVKNNFIDLTLGRRIFSSTRDLYRWGRAMSGSSMLSDTSLKLMQTNHLQNISNDYSYGYGWVVFEQGDQYGMGNLGIDLPYIIHGGSTEGYKSMLVNIDNGAYIISLLANTGSRVNEMKLTEQIVNQLMNTKNEL